MPDITNFRTHSARSGGATSAANSGIPERNFQRHGRWASVLAKNTYIKDSLASRLDVSKSLSALAQALSFISIGDLAGPRAHI